MEFPILVTCGSKTQKNDIKLLLLYMDCWLTLVLHCWEGKSENGGNSICLGWLVGVTGLVGTKKVVSFRTRGHTKSGEFEKENSTFLFFKNV